MLAKFLTMNFDTPGAKAFDWFLSILTLGVGVWYSWHLWIAVGIVGLVASWWRPLTKLQGLARGILIRKARHD